VSSHTGPILARHAGVEVRDCTTCGWAHLDPIPDEAELALMYERAYYQEHNPGWLAKDRSEQAYWDLEHADKLSDWERLLGDGRRRLLDVGCSGGLLMEHAVAHGWEAIGIEPSTEAVEEARAHGLTVHEGLYQDVDVAPGSFDVVHSKLVGEHLPDPRHHLRWARDVLAPGGIVSIQVPNDFNLLQLAARDALGEPDWWVAPPYHINYFSFASLERLLRAEGFEPVGRDTTFPVEWFLLMGENYIGDDALGASVHQRRMALETKLEGLGMRRTLHAHLAAQGVGREAIVHARRPEDA
jgi:SAM-dependent methyltransferase